MERHNINPLFNSESRILILGSFPSVKSRQAQFFYGHPQNRFWLVISSLLGCPPPETTEQKKAMLLKNHIALWDVIASCDIDGSSDSSIKNVTVNDIADIIRKSKIERIFLNGKTAEKYYNKHLRQSVDIKAVTLPSTSPANASYSLEKLICRWKCILN